MSTVQEIERAVESLPAHDLARFRSWFSQFDGEIWDRQIEEDIKAGRLDWLALGAFAIHRVGRDGGNVFEEWSRYCCARKNF